ncbi:hypothetical protein DRE_04920 [Drechslerella stenobrocha 248]|uniref:Uncharacterized protein n=1 Tax=Drechslerella stenobrocha 248 TaxID=1043628 RepID=W7I108_9PEZI|nr:hypothetical protein DRE_04920 [Drechslerella stenobrocha 248]
MQITCHPPLAGTTVVDGDEVNVVVCMDLSPAEAESWREASGVSCAVWHDGCGGGDWTEQAMTRVDAVEVDIFATAPHPTATLHFKTTLRAPTTHDRPVSFTVNYTLPFDANTKLWANHEFQTSDGVILFRRPVEAPGVDNQFLSAQWDAAHSIHTYFSPPPTDQQTQVTVSPTYRTTSTAASSPSTWVYNIKIPAREPDPSSGPGYAEAILGSPVPDKLVSHFATIKHGGAWVQPSHSRNRGRNYEGFRPPRDAVLAAFQTARDVVVFLPISTAENTMYLKGDGDGRIIVIGRNDVTREVEGKVVVVLASDVEQAVDEAMYWVKRITQASVAVDQGPAASEADDPWNDTLKYCTWNSLGRELTERRVVDAVSDFYTTGIKVETIIIDDNWQSLDNNGRDSFGHRWTEFEADKKVFPNGLKGLVAEIKRKNKGVKHVAVWHGILGYWNGVSPNGWIAKNYKLRNVNRGSIHVVDKEDVGRFYDDFYKFLSDQGITAVKADTQCLLDERLPSADKGELFPAYLAAWRNAASKYFGTRAISCMSLVPQILFTNHLHSSQPRFTLRNSDDFFPHTPRSHPWHIFANAHNALFTSRLNVVADWDMFQTRHEWGAYHAAARCISGGPVYITDDVGSHDMSIVRKVTATGSDGRMCTLRPAVGKSLEYFVGFGEGRPVKIVSTAGTDNYKIKMIGTFDLDGGQERTDMVSLRQAIGSDAIANSGSNCYAVYSYSSRTAQLVGIDGYVKTTLKKGGWDVMSVSPIWTVPPRRGEKEGDVRIAVFGLLEQISGAAAVTDMRLIDEGSTIKIGVGLKALGVLGVFANYSDPRRYGRIRQVTVGGEDVPERFIYIGKGSDYGTIRVDIEAAWKYLRLESDSWKIDTWVHLAV